MCREIHVGTLLFGLADARRAVVDALDVIVDAGLQHTKT